MLLMQWTERMESERKLIFNILIGQLLDYMEDSKIRFRFQSSVLREVIITHWGRDRQKANRFVIVEKSPF